MLSSSYPRTKFELRSDGFDWFGLRSLRSDGFESSGPPQTHRLVNEFWRCGTIFSIYAAVPKLLCLADIFDSG